MNNSTFLRSHEFWLATVCLTVLAALATWGIYPDHGWRGPNRRGPF